MKTPSLQTQYVKLCRKRKIKEKLGLHFLPLFHPFPGSLDVQFYLKLKSVVNPREDGKGREKSNCAPRESVRLRISDLKLWLLSTTERKTYRECIAEKVISEL